MRLYNLLQSHISSDPDMAIYAQLCGAQFTRDSKAIYDRKSKAECVWNQQIGYTLHGFSDVDYSPDTWLEFFLPNDSATKFLITIDEGFNYQELNKASYRKWQNEWQDILAHSPCPHHLGYSVFPIGSPILGYSLMAYVAVKEPKAYESAYLEWREKEKPPQAHPDQKRRRRSIAIDGLLDFANCEIEACKYYAFPVILP